jgi:hypothetical protein
MAHRFVVEPRRSAFVADAFPHRTGPARGGALERAWSRAPDGRLRARWRTAAPEG